MPAETLQTLGIVAVLGLLFVLGLKFLDLLPAPDAAPAEGETEEHAAAAEGGQT